MEKQGVLKTKTNSPMKSGETMNGKKYVNFSVAHKGSMLPCTAWESQVGLEDLERLAECTIGTGIVLRGFENDEGCYVVKWFALEGEKAGTEESERDRVFRYYGNERRYRESQRDHFKLMEEKGFVPAYDDTGRFFFEKKDRCVFDEKKKKWVRKIDFCMDVLGVDAVNRRLKELPGSAEIKLGAIRGFPAAEYKKLLEVMVNDARIKQQKQVLPHHGSISTPPAPGDMLEPF